MEIMKKFDQSVAQVLGDKVKARLTFKVGMRPRAPAMGAY